MSDWISAYLEREEDAAQEAADRAMRSAEQRGWRRGRDDAERTCRGEMRLIADAIGPEGSALRRHVKREIDLMASDLIREIVQRVCAQAVEQMRPVVDVREPVFDPEKEPDQVPIIEIGISVPSLHQRQRLWPSMNRWAR